MAIISMLGGHGVGKSTALRRWKERYPDLLAFPLDDMRKEYYGNLEKVALVEKLQKSRTEIGVLETAKGYSAWASILRPTDSLIVVSPANAELGRKWMEERKGRPLTDWWKDKEVQYELIDKFRNYVSKHQLKARFFYLTSREDWSQVDIYFGSIYRKLRNEILRNRLTK